MTDFLEKTLEDIVFENRETIHERGLRKFKDVGFRQFYLPSGKKIDLVCWDIVNGELYLDVYELKREIADISAICQGYDYLNEFIGLVEAGFKKVIPTLIIIGKKHDSLSILNELKIRLEVYTYEYNINGIKFLRHYKNSQIIVPNQIFANVIWAWGTKRLFYPDGQPATVNLYSSYLKFIEKDPDFDHRVNQEKNDFINTVCNGGFGRYYR